MMLISIVNLSRGALPEEDLQRVIRAINRQIAEDFEPYWSFGARLRLEGTIGVRPRQNTLSEMRGDALIYVWDKIDVDDALGYHDRNDSGDEVELSNFVLPSYFTRGEQPGSRNDFLGRPYEGQVLQSFGVNPGGYCGFFDPKTRTDTTFGRKDDTVAHATIARKNRAKLGRGWRRRHNGVVR